MQPLPYDGKDGCPLSTEQKPLMIRGDRLLLALDVLGELFSVNARRHFKQTRLRDAIARIGMTDPSLFRLWDSDDIAQVRAVHAFASFQHFMVDNQQTIGDVLVNAEPMRFRIAFFPTKEHSQRFFSAFASGELTEEDFQERESEIGDR